MAFIKFLGLLLFYLIVILSLEALTLMLTTGTVINTISLPIFNNIDFLMLLIKNNLTSGLREFIAQPVLIIGVSATMPEEYISALYYYPFSSLLHVLFSAFITFYALKNPQQLLQPLFLVSSVLFLVSINYVWLAGCCGAVPGWTLDTMLLSYVFSTSTSSSAHMNLYETLYDWMAVLQIIILFTAVLLLRWSVSRNR